MKLQDLVEGRDPEQDAYRTIEVEASYTNDMSTWVSFDKFMNPAWKWDSYGQEQGLVQILQNLQQNGHVEVDIENRQVRLNQEKAMKSNESRRRMSDTASDYENNTGKSFTAGT